MCARRFYKFDVMALVLAGEKTMGFCYSNPKLFHKSVLVVPVVDLVRLGFEEIGGRNCNEQ